MAETWFTPKEWKARLVEFAGRRLLRNVANGQSATYDVSRSEGLVSQEGDAFNTKNMNDLEQRISNGFANAKTNIDALNMDLQNKMSKYYGSATLSEANEKAILKHLLLDVDLMGKYGNCNFSVIVNSAQFYSGTMYSDGGVTAWGQIQQRNIDNAPGSLYSFYYNRGADPVLKKLGSQPFTATFYLDYTRGAGQNSDSKHFSGAGNSKINLDVTNYDKVTFSNLIVNGQEIQDVTANGTVVGNGSVLNLSSVSNLEIKMSGGGNLQGGKNWSGNVSITATFE